LTLQKQRPDEFINVGGADNLANLSELTEEKLLEEVKTRYFTHNIQAGFAASLKESAFRHFGPSSVRNMILGSAVFLALGDLEKL
jgi:hypothetical protein